MKKLSLLVGISFTLLCTSSYSQTITVAKLKKTPGHIVGGMLLEVIYHRANIPLEFRTIQSKTALTVSSEGRVDGELQRIFKIGEEYPTLIRVPTSFTYFEPAAFSKKHEFPVSGWSSLDGYGVVGMVRGMKFAEVGLEGIENTFSVAGSDQLMKMLDKGRLDIVVTARFNGLYYISKLNLDSIHQLHPVIERKELYHYLHEKHKSLIPRIDEVIKSMKKSGELERLREEFSKKILE